MKTITKQVNLFEYNELSKEAKEDSSANDYLFLEDITLYHE